MKTISMLFIGLIGLMATSNAKNISTNVEITSAKLVYGTVTTAGTTNKNVMISWVAKFETSKSYYEIERSFYNNDFNTIATLQNALAAGGNIKNYRITDDAAAFVDRAVVYYRVKQVDADGNVNYSNVTVVQLQEGNNIATTTDKKCTSLRFVAAQDGSAVIRIQTTTGKTIAARNAIVSRGMNKLNLDNVANFSKGIFMAEISVNGTVIDKQKFIVE